MVLEQLEAKNLKNFGFFGDLWLFLGGFWPVTLNCMVSSRQFGTLAVPGAASIVKIIILK